MQNKKIIDLMRPKQLYEKAIALRDSDAHAYFKRYGRYFEGVPCVSCQGKKFTKKFNKYGFTHVECQRCKTLFVTPRPTEEYLLRYYSEFKAPEFWTEVLLRTDNSRKYLQYAPRAKRLIDICRKYTKKSSLSLLDVGAGAGNFSLAVKEQSFFNKIIALDINKKCNAVCNEKGLRVFLGGLEDIDSKFDCIAMNDIIEHVFSPRVLLKAALCRLNTNGILMIATPNYLGFDFTLFGKDTDNITPPEHLQYFNPFSIVTLLRKIGFSVIDVSTPGILDVEIAERKIKGGYKLKNNKYIQSILSLDKIKNDDFQHFLQVNQLSSHMLIFAKKGR